MDQITGALVAIALVLGAVFVPMAFFGGSIGVIYRQFSITLVSAMALSVLVALILTPALCATILKPLPPSGHVEHKGFFRWFNRTFDAGRERHERGLTAMLKRPSRSMFVYLAIVVVVGLLFTRIPSSFLPAEDPGFAYGQVTTPPGASKERTWAVLDAAQKYLLEQEKDAVEGVLTVNGFNFAGPGQNSGLLFIKLRDWDERKKSTLSVSAVLGRANKYFASVKDAQVIAIPPPAVLELGNTAGFDLMLQNRGGLDRVEFLAARNQLLGAAAQDPRLAGVRPNGVEDAPQFKLDIDREKASALGISVADINATLQTGWASTYVNDFIDRGRVKRVYVQGDPDSRMQPDDLNRWYVRNKDGGMVPFSAFGRGEWTYGPQKLVRFNGVPAYQIQGGPAPGRSSGEAMQAMEELVAKLPAGRRSRMERPVVRGEGVRLAGADAVCVVARDRVPVPRGAVRELVDPGDRVAGRAARRTRRRHRDAGARAHERRLFPGRSARHDRPRRQERHPHRGVRQGEFRPRHGSRRVGDARDAGSVCVRSS